MVEGVLPQQQPTVKLTVTADSKETWQAVCKQYEPEEIMVTGIICEMSWFCYPHGFASHTMTEQQMVSR